MSNAEIGAIMERTEGAIKSLYHRTLLSLRQEFAQLDESQNKQKGEKRGQTENEHTSREGNSSGAR
jgi:hypothetical protein